MMMLSIHSNRSRQMLTRVGQHLLREARPVFNRSLPRLATTRHMMPAKLVCLMLLPCLALHAQDQYHFRTLHEFGNAKDGAGVWDSVTVDDHGSVYGTTSGGGAYRHGIVFRLELGRDGRRAETIIHNFPDSPVDGQGPLGGMLFDPSGTLYGTTQGGGGNYEYGTVFKMSLGPSGWKETILHRFGLKDQACCPQGNLAWDTKADLYGTADSIFELFHGKKYWMETVLHIFTGRDGDGSGPEAGPIRDTAGNLYGTTLGGGGGGCGGGCGTVWELSPPVSGLTQGWAEHILHRFGIGDTLAFPGVGQLAMDRQGNLYGTVNGGKYRAGVIYKLSPVPNGSAAGGLWRETILYNFTGGSDGGPSEGVILDKAGNLYGTTGVGGKFGEGTVFKLSPQPDGSWKFTLLHTFTGADGAEPANNPTLGPDGKLYGTTATGGKYGGGVVFEVTP